MRRARATVTVMVLAIGAGLAVATWAEDLELPVEYATSPRVTATLVEDHSNVAGGVWHAGIDLPRADGADTVRASGNERLHWALTTAGLLVKVRTVTGDSAFVRDPWGVSPRTDGGIPKYMLDVIRVQRITPGKPVVTYQVDYVSEFPGGSGFTNDYISLVPNFPTPADTLVFGDRMSIDFAYYPARLHQGVFQNPDSSEYRWYSHIDKVHQYVAWNTYPATNTNRFYGPYSVIPAGRDTFEIAAGVSFAEIEQVLNFPGEPHHLHFSTSVKFQLPNTATNPLSLNRFGYTDPQNNRPIVRNLAFRNRQSGAVVSSNILFGAIDIFAESRDDMGSPENIDDGDGAENAIRETGCYNAGYWIAPDSCGGSAVATSGAPNLLFAGAGKDSVTGTDPLSEVLWTGLDSPFRVDTNTNYYLQVSHVGEAVDRFWHTGARRVAVRNDGSGGPDARDNSEAKFRDGRYKVSASARDVVGFGLPRDSTVIVDNFRPYVRKVVVKDGSTEISRAEWKLSGGFITFSFLDPDSSMLDASGKKRSTLGTADVTIEVTFSEPMQEARIGSILPLGYVPTLARVPGEGDTIWRAVIPAAKIDLKPGKNGRQQIGITGNDLASNQLRSISSNASFFAATNMRNPAGVMQGSGGTDVMHRFAIGEPVALLIDVTASMAQEIQTAKSSSIGWIDALDANRSKFPVYTVITFQDQATHHITTTDPQAARDIINVLGIDGGGDCPEASVTALSMLPGLMPKGGSALLSTDADARESAAFINQTKAALAALGIRVDSAVLGRCPPPGAPGGPFGTDGGGGGSTGQSEHPGESSEQAEDGPVVQFDPLSVYRRLSGVTGGTYFNIHRDDYAEALEILFDQLESTSLLATREDTLDGSGPLDYVLPIEPGVEAVTFIHNAFPESNQSFSLRRPGGAVVNVGDPDVTLVSAASASSWVIDAPAAGDWTVEIDGTGEFSCRATARSSRWLGLLVGPGAEPALPGQPVPVVIGYQGEGVLVAGRLLGANGDVIGSLELFDDGEHGDGSAADLVYGGTTTLAAPGSYRIAVDGVGPDAFTREVPQSLFLGQPEITVDYGSVAFDPTQVGESRLRALSVSNLGSLPLRITSVTSDNSSFEASIDSLTLPPAGSVAVRLHLTPVAAESLSATLTISSNDPVNPEITVTLTAVGTPAAVATASRDSVIAAASLGDSVDIPIRLYNDGDGPLRFGVVTAADPAGNGNPGYGFLASDGDPGPPHHWVRLDSTAIVLADLGDEEVRGPFPIGFPFPYFGQMHTEFHVSSNGFITLGVDPGGAHPSGDCPGLGPLPANLIGPEWLNLDPASAGQVRYRSTGSMLVVEYRWVAGVTDPATRYAFQAVLGADGTIAFNYRSVPNDPASVAVLVDETGNGGTAIYCHDYVNPHPDLTAEIHPVVPWLRPLTTAGGVVSGDSVDIVVRLSARQAGLDAGQTLESALVILTNDPTARRLSLPVRFSVQPGIHAMGGTVTSLESGLPLAGAIVNAAGYIGTFADTTDTAGAYLLEKLPADNYMVSAAAVDYLTSGPDSVAIPPSATLDLALGRPTLSMSPGEVSRFVVNGGNVSVPVTIRNPGTLPLEVSIKPEPPSASPTGLLAPAAVDPPGLFQSTTVLTDPVGDSSIDLLGLDADLDVSSVTFRVRMADPVNSTPFAGYLSMDIDRNPATGALPGFGQGLATQDIGSEMEISFSSVCNGHVNLYDRVPPHHVALIPVQISGAEVEFTIPYALLESADGSMNVSMVVFPGSCGGDAPGVAPLGGSGVDHDWAPEVGHGIVGTCPWLSVTPAEGVVAPGDSLVVLLGIDAGAYQDTTLDCHLTVMTNDPRVAERSLPVHVAVTAVGAVDASPAAPPVQAILHQNRPNPFHLATRIGFVLPRAERISLRVYDVAGRLVSTLVEGLMPAGPHEVEWIATDGRSPSGIFFYRLEIGSFVATRKMLHMP